MCVSPEGVLQSEFCCVRETLWIVLKAIKERQQNYNAPFACAVLTLLRPDLMMKWENTEL